MLDHDEPSRLVDVRLEGATFHNVNFSGAQLSETVVQDVELWAWGRNLTSPVGLRINGVDVGPLVDAELDRRFPERLVLRDIVDVGVFAVRSTSSPRCGSPRSSGPAASMPRS